MPPSGLSVERQDEILQEIGELLAGALRPGWSRATFAWTGIVGGGVLSSLTVLDEEGRSRTDTIPRGMNKLCGRLKDGMYRPGAGTWLTMTYTLSADGGHTADYDFNREPELGGFGPGQYAKEVAAFPRDPEHTPDWLSAALERVPNFYAAVYAEPGEQYEIEIGPHLGEVARAFDHGGWIIGPGEYRNEFEFTAEWASLRTLSQYGLVRLAGKVDPDRWDDLIAFLTGQGWNFGASLYEGEKIVANVDPARPPAV
ncbi:hypothetical protein AB0L00_29505 [Actinoallomurus sp. NPDC052308]|uniref:hypothetical protein n=1 Tax=Actinoallomurus sp. NPDC052308 TaxID=3155530 RepID=UPI0034223048